MCGSSQYSCSRMKAAQGRRRDYRSLLTASFSTRTSSAVPLDHTL